MVSTMFKFLICLTLAVAFFDLCTVDFFHWNCVRVYSHTRSIATHLWGFLGNDYAI